MTNIWNELLDVKKRLPLGQRVVLTEPPNWVCLLPENHRGLEGEVVGYEVADPNRYYYQYIEVTVSLDAGLTLLQCHPTVCQAI